ncbi:MAG: hypothetical protein ACAI43_10930 [Phycisphaerae bacterium]|nr:hypothetical protein [Tepidisphaeraceae bacterium]
MELFLLFIVVLGVGLFAQRARALAAQRSTCPRCGSRRTRAFCARCGTRVRANGVPLLR